MEENREILSGGESQDGIVENQTVLQSEPGTAPVNAPEAPAFDKLLGPDGALAENWRELLPENIRGEKSLEAIKHFSTLAQSYVHAQKAIGANKIAIPGANATDEEKAAFFTALGRPESAEKYETKTPETLPEGIEISPETMKSFHSLAFELGLNPGQVQALVDFQVNMMGSQVQALTAARDGEYDDTVSRLQNEFGAGFGKVVEQAKKAADAFGLNEVLQQNGLLNNYGMIKALAAIGERFSESRLRGEPADSMPKGIDEQYQEIMDNPDDPYFHKDHPAHGRQVEKMKTLLKAMEKRPNPLVTPDGGNN